jgi:hypothetical protein
LNDTNIPKNLIDIVLNKNYDFNKLNINKNILIFTTKFYDMCYTNNLPNDFKIKFTEKQKFDLHIRQNLVKNKLIGNIILKELTEKVFHPNRLLNICNKYNIEFDKLLEIY